MIIIDQGGQAHSASSHEGEEFGYVLSETFCSYWK